MLKFHILLLFGLILATGFLLITTTSLAHQNAGGTCYHPPNQWVMCCGANFCSGCDLDNICTTCFVDGNGNESGCYSRQPSHSANDDLCTNDGLGTDSCPIDQCDPVGADCSPEAVFQYCSDGTTPCQWGHKKCQLTSAGNRCSSLYTIDKDQCSQCDTNPPNPDPPIPYITGDRICTPGPNNPCGCTGSGCQNGPNTTDNRCCHRECNASTGNVCKTVYGGGTSTCTTENASCSPVPTPTTAQALTRATCNTCDYGKLRQTGNQADCDYQPYGPWPGCYTVASDTDIRTFPQYCYGDSNTPKFCGYCTRCTYNSSDGTYTFQRVGNSNCNYNSDPLCVGNAGTKDGTCIWPDWDPPSNTCCTSNWSCTAATACVNRFGTVVSCDDGSSGPNTQTLYCTDGCGGSKYLDNQLCNTQPCPYIISGHLYEDTSTSCTGTTPYTAAISGFINTSDLGPGAVNYPVPGSGQYQLFNLLGGGYTISPNISASLYRASICSSPITKIVPPSITDFSVDFFVVPQQTLTVVKIGTAANDGVVKGGWLLNEINCGSACSARFDRNVSVKVTATRGTSSVFAGWFQDAGGTLPWPTVAGNYNCRGTATSCAVSLNTNKTIYAKFDIYYPPWLKTSGDVHINQ